MVKIPQGSHSFSLWSVVSGLCGISPSPLWLGIKEWTEDCRLALPPEFLCLFGHGNLTRALSIHTIVMLNRAQSDFHSMLGSDEYNTIASYRDELGVTVIRVMVSAEGH